MPKKTEKVPLPTVTTAAATRPYKDRFSKTGTGISKPPPKKKPKKKKKKVKRSEALKKGPGVEERHHTVIISANEFGPITHAPKKQAVKKSSSRFDATPKIKTAQSQFTTTSQKRKRKLRDRK